MNIYELKDYIEKLINDVITTDDFNGWDVWSEGFGWSFNKDGEVLNVRIETE